MNLLPDRIAGSFIFRECIWLPVHSTRVTIALMDYSMGEHQNQGEQNFYQPGVVVTPGAPQQIAPTPEIPAAQPEAIYAPAEPAQYPEAYASPASSEMITWTASEAVNHQKTGSWYTMIGIAAVLIAALVWLMTRDFFPAIAVFVGVVTLGAYAAQKPRQETYTLDNSGLTIGKRRYLYSDFRSFTVVPEGAGLSVELTPTKRFAMYVSMYIDPANEDRILDQLSGFVPMEEHKANLADSVMRRIRS